MRRKLWRLKEKYFKEMRKYSKIIEEILLNDKHVKELPEELLYKTKKGLLKEENKSHLWPFVSKIGYEACGGKNPDFSYIAAATQLWYISLYAADTIFDEIKISKKNRVELEDLVCFGPIMENISLELLVEGLERMKINKDTYSELFKHWTFSNKKLYLEYYLENHSKYPFNKKTPSEDFTLERVRYYDPVYFSLMLGNIVSENKVYISKIEKIAENLVLAFMMVEDIGDFGKKQEDIRNGVYTLPIIYTLKTSDKAKLDVFYKAFGKREKCNKEDLLKAAEIIVKSGAIEYCQNYALRFLKEASNYIKLFPKSKERDMLIALAIVPTYINKYVKNIESLFDYKVDTSKMLKFFKEEIEKELFEI